jgi:uncharacterized protein with HEPN domain
VKRADTERLADIAAAIDRIRAHLANARAGEDLRRDATLYNLVIIGEAVKSLSEQTKAKRADIPWQQIGGLRDRLAHEYFRIDIPEIEKIVSRDLAPLRSAVTGLRKGRS